MLRSVSSGRVRQSVVQAVAAGECRGYGQFGPQAAQVQGVQAAQGGPDVNALAAAAGQRLAGPPDAAAPWGSDIPGYAGYVAPPGAPAAEGPQGPEGVLAPAQGFFSRMVGEKGSGKRSDIGRSMMAAGARMMQGSTEGTFATIGEGLETGLGAYGEAKTARQLEEDRGFTAEERARDAEDRAAQKAVSEKIQEITGGWDENTTIEQRVSDLQRAANVAFGNADAPLGRGLLEEARDIGVDTAGGSTTRFTNYDQIKYRDPDGNPTRGRLVTVTHANGEVEQTFEYLDKEVLKNNLNEGMGAGEAQIDAWRPGGHMADPAKETTAAEASELKSAQERLNNNLRRAALGGLRGLVVDAITGEPNYLDYKMAGAVATYDDTGNPVSWRRGGLAHIETWQALLGDWISNAGSEVVGGPTKFINMIVRSQLPSAIQEGYTEALNYINPTVRFLSGAQMTNQEAMRYYNALIAMPGDSPRNIELKRRKRDVLTNAMGGAGITEAQKQEAREILEIAPGFDMSHAFGDFGLVDDSGVYAMDYYLARLDQHPSLGVSNTFSEDELRELGDADTGSGGPSRRGRGAGGLGSDLVIGGNR